MNHDSYVKQAGGVGAAAWRTDPAAEVVDLARALHALRCPRPIVILDAASGPGRNIPPWSGHGAVVCAVDASPEAVGHAASLPGVVGQVGDLRALPFVDGCFDAVQCIDALHLVPPAAASAALAEMGRVVRPGGFLLISAYAPGDVLEGDGAPVYSGKDLRAMFPPGFVFVRGYRRAEDDPPHGDLRPYQHRHVSVAVLAQRETFPGGDR